MLNKDSAICIRSIDYSETSQIVTFFTRTNGKISAIAKGSKRLKSHFDGPVEMFSYGEIIFTESASGKLATLTEFAQQSTFINLSKNLFALNCSMFAAELLNNLTDDYDSHQELFDSFLGFLKNAAKANDTLALLILFQLTLLKEVGLQPVLSNCANCKIKLPLDNTKQHLYFSSSINGFICPDCEAAFPDKISLPRNAAKCLANLKLLTEAEKETLNDIEKAMIHHFTELIGHRLKMAKYVIYR
ncbi:MAG: DNA repair protein RecO [Planctomycetes bacterium]|nr:DNA repair protein RecO [Planctomycetota bacterium]